MGYNWQQLKMKKVLKAMGLMALMMAVALAVSAFTKANVNKDATSGDKYSCKVEIFKPNGSHYVSGNIEAWVYRKKNSTFFNEVKCWIDSDGKGTITWDEDLGDFVGRIYFRDWPTNYVIKDIELRNGGSYKLTAVEN